MNAKQQFCIVCSNMGVTVKYIFNVHKSLHPFTSGLIDGVVNLNADTDVHGVLESPYK